MAILPHGLTPEQLANEILKIKNPQSSYSLAVKAKYNSLSEEDKKKVLDAIVGKKVSVDELVDAIETIGANSSFAYEILKNLPEEDQKKLEDAILNTKGNNL